MKIRNKSGRRAKFYDGKVGVWRVLEPGEVVDSRVIPEDTETFEQVQEQQEETRPKIKKKNMEADE